LLFLVDLRAILTPNPISRSAQSRRGRRSILIAPPASMTIRSRSPGPRLAGERSVPLSTIAVLIGIGATLAWQSYGDEAKNIVVTKAPSLGWLLSASKTRSPVASATSPDLGQQLAPLALNLDVVRRSIEQLAAKQEQMGQNITAVRALEEEIRQKLSAPPPAQQEASVPQNKPPQSRAPSSAMQSSAAPSPRPPSVQPLRLLDSPAQPPR
jgi:hypothetical protein